VLYLAVALDRDFRSRTTILQVVADRVAVVALVRRHRACISVPLLHQRIIGGHIVGFPGGVSTTPIGRPPALQRRWILVVKPPRERPSAWK
jgi:hypothetical protein